MDENALSRVTQVYGYLIRLNADIVPHWVFE